MDGQIGSFKTPMAPSNTTMNPGQVAAQSSEEVNAARQAKEQELTSKVPAAPEVPKAQKGFDPKEHMALFGAMMMLSMMFGRKTGDPMTAAMNNMTASLKGIQQGNAEVQQANEQQMWQNFNAGMAAHKAAMDEYKTDLEKMYKDPKYGQNAVYLKMLEHGMKPEVAAMYSDPASASKIYEANLKAHMHALDVAGKMKDSMAVSPSNIALRMSGETATSIVGYRGNARQALNNAAIQKRAQDEGIPIEQAAREQAQQDVQYLASKTSQGQLVKMKGATVVAVKQLEYNAQRAKDAMDKLGTSNLSPILNAIITGTEKWTGDPAYADAFYFMNATAMESARIMSGGQASVAQLHEGAREEAQKWANINLTPATWEKVSNDMIDEGRARIDQYDEGIAIQSQPITGIDGRSLSSEYQQALEWANNNPNDPRAAKIKQRLGM